MPHEWFISVHGNETPSHEKKTECKLEYFSGIHHQKSCAGESNTAQWTATETFYRENRRYLFPAENLTLHIRYDNKRPFEKLNGGWSDLRDRQLCLSFAFNGAENLPGIDEDT